MKSNEIKAAAAKAGKTLTSISAEIDESVQNLTQKMKRERLTSDEMEKIASVLNCKYKCYFEFDDGTKIGKF